MSSSDEEVASSQCSASRCISPAAVSQLGSESEFDDGGSHWIPMKLWNFEDIEKKGQDAVDIEVLEVANEFMRDGNILAHPLHEEGESDLGLWKALSESIIHKNSTLVRVFRCPLLKRCRCKVQLKIEEGPGGLLMLRRGWHDDDSHADPYDKSPVIRFLNGKTLIRESEMPRSFLEKSLQEKHNKPDGQPEYIILEEEGPPELVEDEDDDGYVQDLVRGPCVYVRELGVYVSEQRAGRLSKYLPKNGDYERTYFTREVISHT